jgi:hypothetical protein
MEMLSTPAYECIFDFGEVVEVVQNRIQESEFRSQKSGVRRQASGVRRQNKQFKFIYSESGVLTPDS